MKYYLRRYRSPIVTVVMLAGAFFFISTLVNVLDEVMRRKAPPSAVENYVPPRAAPTMTSPVNTGARTVFHADRG